VDAFRGRWRQRRPWAQLAEQVGCFAGEFVTRLVGRRGGRLAAQGAGLAKSRLEALGKGLSLSGRRGLKNHSSQKTAGLGLTARRARGGGRRARVEERDRTSLGHFRGRLASNGMSRVVGS